MMVEKIRITWNYIQRELESCISGRKCSEAWKFVKNIKNDNIEMKENNIPIKD